MKPVKFNLITLFVAVTVAGFSVWANTGESIVISNSPSAWGLPGFVSIRVSSGWPFRYRGNALMVRNDRADDFVRNWPKSIAGAKPSPVDFGKLNADVLVGCCSIGLAAVGCELVVRRAQRRQISTSPESLLTGEPRDCIAI